MYVHWLCIKNRHTRVQYYVSTEMKPSFVPSNVKFPVFIFSYFIWARLYLEVFILLAVLCRIMHIQPGHQILALTVLKCLFFKRIIAGRLDNTRVMGYAAFDPEVTFTNPAQIYGNWKLFDTNGLWATSNVSFSFLLKKTQNWKVITTDRNDWKCHEQHIGLKILGPWVY